MVEHILKQYMEQPCKAGEMLTVMNLKATIGAKFGSQIWESLDKMVGNGLLEQRPDKHESMFFLTELGESEMNKLFRE